MCEDIVLNVLKPLNVGISFIGNFIWEDVLFFKIKHLSSWIFGIKKEEFHNRYVLFYEREDLINELDDIYFKEYIDSKDERSIRYIQETILDLIKYEKYHYLKADEFEKFDFYDKDIDGDYVDIELKWLESKKIELEYAIKSMNDYHTMLKFIDSLKNNSIVNSVVLVDLGNSSYNKSSVRYIIHICVISSKISSSDDIYEVLRINEYLNLRHHGRHKVELKYI